MTMKLTSCPIISLPITSNCLIPTSCRQWMSTFILAFLHHLQHDDPWFSSLWYRPPAMIRLVPSLAQNKYLTFLHFAYDRHHTHHARSRFSDQMDLTSSASTIIILEQHFFARSGSSAPSKLLMFRPNPVDLVEVQLVSLSRPFRPRAVQVSSKVRRSPPTVRSGLATTAPC